MCWVYLAGSTFCAVQWWPLFSLAEIRVVWMAAPQLFARIKCSELRGENKYNMIFMREKENDMMPIFHWRAQVGFLFHCGQYGTNKMIRQFISHSVNH